MARVAIELPALGFDMETGRLASWLKQVGDTVRKGDAIADLEAAFRFRQTLGQRGDLLTEPGELGGVVG